MDVFFSKSQAVQCALDYSFLLGYHMPIPFNDCAIDLIEVRKTKGGSFDVFLKHRITKHTQSPELLNFRYLTISLFDYLDATGIQYL